VAQTGAVPVHAFDQVETLLGQGTLAMELAAQAPARAVMCLPSASASAWSSAVATPPQSTSARG